MNIKGQVIPKSPNVQRLLDGRNHKAHPDLSTIWVIRGRAATRDSLTKKIVMQKTTSHNQSRTNVGRPDPRRHRQARFNTGRTGPSPYN
ncbi:hypothetical protein ZHAS_00000206 [Anopheles sinensis]|uniref:Uncharacterized protein n=1 Tax=Anopheles sinensis TaxID=74873 RepID=A0A084V9Z7_ANOSI|nr:hypothetical protein ZHAS_00000206 [Anopheles sinensis]